MTVTQDDLDPRLLRRLTAREREFLLLAGDAATHAEMAALLGISLSGAKYLGRQCRRKLSPVEGKLLAKRQLVRWARELRIQNLRESEEA